MKSRKCLILILIASIFMISLSAVGAADDSASDIGSMDDNLQITSQDDIAQDISRSAGDGEEPLEANIDDESELEKTAGEESVLENDDTQDDSSDADGKKSGSANVNVGDAKEKTKISAKTKKASSKNKASFKTVSKGSKDKAMVKKIQKALKRNGYYRTYKGHYLKVDGWYGPCTERSVKQFQKAKKLKVTGKVDQKTAMKLKVISGSAADSGSANAEIILYCKDTFETDCGSGESFIAKIVNKKTGKGISTQLRVDYTKKGFSMDEYYYTGSNGINYITPSSLEVGTYKVKVSVDKSFTSKIKAKPVTKTIKISKTSIKMKAKKASADANKNVELKVVLKFKIGDPVNEGKVKFTVDGKSYTVKVKDGVASKSIKLENVKSKQYTATFLGTKNIKVQTVTGKIA